MCELNCISLQQAFRWGFISSPGWGRHKIRIRTEILEPKLSTFLINYSWPRWSNFHLDVIAVPILSTANAFLCVLKHNIKVAIGSGEERGRERGDLLTRRPSCNSIAQSGSWCPHSMPLWQNEDLQNLSIPSTHPTTPPSPLTKIFPFFFSFFLPTKWLSPCCPEGSVIKLLKPNVRPFLKRNFFTFPPLCIISSHPVFKKSNL